MICSNSLKFKNKSLDNQNTGNHIFWRVKITKVSKGRDVQYKIWITPIILSPILAFFIAKWGSMRLILPLVN